MLPLATRSLTLSLTFVHAPLYGFHGNNHAVLRRADSIAAHSRSRRPASVQWKAGLDPGSPPPDAFYFGGVFIVAISALLLQYQSYGGKLGLGNFLKSGPEDKNWERKQAMAAMDEKTRLNMRNNDLVAGHREAKDSWWAAILPKLDFVEVYGQEPTPRRKGPEMPAPAEELTGAAAEVAAAAAAEATAGMTPEELSAELLRAVERQDWARAAELKRIAEAAGDSDAPPGAGEL